MENKEKKSIISAAAPAGHLGVSMSLCVVLGFLFGRFLDARFETTPVWIIIFTIFGIAASFKTLFDAGVKGLEKKK